MHYNKTIRKEADTPVRQAQLVMLEMLKVTDHICRKHSISYWLDAGTLLGAVRHKGFIPWDDDLDIGMPREDYNRFLEIAPKELPPDLFFQTRETDKSIWKWIKIRDNYSTFIQKTEKNKKIKYHQGIFIDIFPFDLVDSSSYNAKLFLNRRFQLSVKTKPYAWFLNPLSTVIVKLIGYKRMKDIIIRHYSKNKPKHVTLGIDAMVSFHFFDYDTVFPVSEIKFEGHKFMAPANPDKYLTDMFGDYMTLPEKSERKTHAYKIFPFKKSNHKAAIQY